MHARVLFGVVFGFLAGVALRSLLALSSAWALFALLLAFVTLLFVLIDSRRAQALILTAIVLVSMSVGIMRTALAVRTGDPVLTTLLNQNISIEGTVAAEPDVRESGVHLTVDSNALITGSSSVVPITARILVLVPPQSGIVYGDVIRAEGKLVLPEAFDTGLGRSFDYPSYLAKDDILYELVFAKVTPTGERHGNLVVRAALAVKHAYLHGLSNALPEPEAGFAGGITVGDKRSIGSELSAQFQKVSLVHMLVLSGYNITLVIAGAASLLGFFGRTIQLGGSAGVVFAFILMAGGAASAVRAGAMALLAMYARLSGRTFVAMRALCAVCAAMVLYNPLILLYDPSFQLSVLATIGLVLFSPLIAERLRMIPERFGLREIAAATIGTQLAVMPLLLYQNGNLSIVAFPANLFALVPVPLAMIASAFAALAGLVLGPAAPIAALPAYLLLAYIIAVAQFFAHLPFASVAVPAFSVWWMIGAYALLALVYLVLQKKTAGMNPAEKEPLELLASTTNVVAVYATDQDAAELKRQ